MKMNTISMLGLILLLGSFLYVFEIFYHGFVHEDFNKVQIILTFFVMLLSAGFLFGYQVIEERLKEKDIVKMLSFFGFALVFLFLIFYTRNMNAVVPLFFSLVYFASAVFLALKKSADFEDPMIRFAFRFFIVVGLMILPVAAYQYIMTGAVDFRFKSVYLPMINIITVLLQGILNTIGIHVYSIPAEGGYSLSLLDDSYSVFIGAFCSGVTSMGVFIAAFFAMAMDLKLTVKRRLLLFAVGVFGTFLANVMRVLLLFLTGLYFGRDALFAVHTHLGWILFFIWISMFWVLAFKFAEKGVDDNNISKTGIKKSKSGKSRYKYKAK